MKNSSLYLPGFHLSTLRRKSRSLSRKLADGLAKTQYHSISPLGEWETRDTHRFVHWYRNNRVEK